jgi:hypothetical protein
MRSGLGAMVWLPDFSVSSRVYPPLSVYRDFSFKCARLAFGFTSQGGYPAMIFFISFSAQAIESLVEVPVTAFAIMFGRM